MINPDTLWNKKYLEEVKKLEEIFYKNNKPSLLIVNKKLSLDTSFTGDFNLINETISKDKKNQFIFTGLHITSRNFLTMEKSKVFSMNKIWDDLIKNKLSKDHENQFVFTGLHITSRNFLTIEKSKVFPMNKIWDDLVKKNDLCGMESKHRFYHLNTFEMYNKISNLSLID